MQCSCLLRLLPPLLVLAACGPDQPPTEPSPPAGPGGSTAGAVGHETVTSLADPGDGTCNAAQCTLREAINAPGSSEISFASGLTGTITLAAPSAGGGLLEIGKALTITGPAAGIVVQRRSVDPEFRILRVGAAGKVTLSNLTLRNGKTDGDGGGIINFGTLVLDRCTVADNSPNGIGNHGTLTLEQATVRDNSPGSGIFNHNDDTLTISESMVARNAGSGIFNLGGTIALTGSTVARNGFGGIYSARGLVTITEARIVDNSTPQDGGGILVFNAGLTLRRSTVARNSADNGGGIANHDGGETVISRSTIVANSAAVEGGGILNTVRQRLRASVTITNSTISGNSAGFFGGGVANGGFLSSASLQLTNSTVVRNSAAQEGGGLFLATDESVAGLVNTIVAQNSAPPDPTCATDIKVGRWRRGPT
jgi:CSLREA domain-containing protein